MNTEGQFIRVMTRARDYLMVDNVGGSALVLTMIYLGLFGALVTSIIQTSQYMSAKSSSGQSLESRESLKREVDLIFNNRDLCLTVIRIEGDNFFFQNLLKPNTSYLPGVSIDDLKIINISDANYKNIKGLRQAKFTVNYKFIGSSGSWMQSSYARTVSYKLNDSGGVSECHAEPDKLKACRLLGAIWDSDHDRCDICRLTGGRWVLHSGMSRCAI